MFLKVLFALVFIPVFASPQSNYVFQHLTPDDGLSSQPNIKIFQDAKGFYWFNTVDGIQRFDGKNFISYNYNYNSNKDVSYNWVKKPVEDKEKSIWIINKEGLNILYRNKQQLQRFYLPDAADSNINNVADVIKDEQDKIWIVTDKNVFRYDDVAQKPVLFSKVITDKSTGIISAIYDTATKKLYLLLLGAYYQLASFNLTTKQFSYIINSLDNVLGHQRPISLFQPDKENNLWIANYAGDFYKYNIRTAETERYFILYKTKKRNETLPASTAYDCVDDDNGAIWFATDNSKGLLRYDKKTDSFSVIKNDNGNEYGLHYDANIYSLLRDNEGNIWVDTDWGLNIFNTKNQQFNYLVLKNNNEKNKGEVTSIFQSANKHIWISTYGNGVFEYDSNFVFLNNYVHNKNPASLGDTLNRTWCIAEDDKGKIWIGCQHGMLSVLDPLTGKFINKTIAAFNEKTIMHVAADKEHNLWFGLYSGVLAKWDAARDTIIIYNNLYNHTSALSIIEGLYIDKDNNVWTGTGKNGLNRFNTVSDSMDENALFNQHIFSLSSLNDSVIIGGTSGKGLLFYNKLNRQLKFLNITNGLSSNTVYGALPGNNKDVWILTGNSIQRLNLLTSKISSFGNNDGIRDHIFSRVIYKLANGTIMIGANSGIIYFNPKDIEIKPLPQNITITAFVANQQSFPVDSLLQLKSIHLKYNQNVLVIEYGSLSFNGRKTDTYFYKLEPSDKNWIVAGMQRSVTYANLSPGNYVFKVKAQNTDGIETKNFTQLNIIILSPWWQTWWAYIAWFLIAVFISYKIYDYRKNNRLAVAAMRQKIASDLHDDIGSTLNSISVYSEVAVKNLNTDADKAKTLIYKMGDVSRNMIDTMNDIVWSINPKNDQFENILQRMQYFAGELLSGKNILLQFTADETVKNIKLPMEKRKNFYLIFKESINNTYKYSGSNTVQVSILEGAGKLIMIIEDKGLGFNTEQKARGNGLKNMQSRAKEMHAILNIKSEAGKGTIIKLLMPIK